MSTSSQRSAQEHERVAARADALEAGLLVDADGRRVGRQHGEHHVLQAEDVEAPVEREAGGLGAQPASRDAAPMAIPNVARL